RGQSVAVNPRCVRKTGSRWLTDAPTAGGCAFDSRSIQDRIEIYEKSLLGFNGFASTLGPYALTCKCATDRMVKAALKWVVRAR
ncbi:MAG TPA: hypothetical protein VLV76_24490, partial [Candidatus Acidoferrum sp.]|nr:hypothetical protein [Candidatus Acidoferrum sp.]